MGNVEKLRTEEIAEKINELIHELCSGEDEYSALGHRVSRLSALMSAIGINGKIIINDTTYLYPYIEIWQ